jgi:hypothetical protein
MIKESSMSKPVAKSALALAAAAFIPLAALASSHREAPAITGLPKLDATDVFAFMSYEEGREGYVTLIANYYPFQDPFAGPNYFALDESAQYMIRIDNDGDAREDITFVFDFDNDFGGPDGRGIRLPVGSQRVPVPLKNVGPVSVEDESLLNSIESYTLLVQQRSGDSGFARTMDGQRVFRKPFDFAGTKTFGSAEAYETYARQYIHEVQLPGCEQPGKLFVGQRDEPFQINVGKIFDLVNFVPVEEGAVPNLSGIAQTRENDTLANKNVTSLALEVHSSCLTGRGNGAIGIWTTANQVTQSGNDEERRSTHSQVSRLGMPLVNEVVIGLPSKDVFNRSRPRDDASFLEFVTNPTLPAILDTLFRGAVNEALPTDVASLAPTNLPRNDLVAAFLTGFEGVNQLAKVTPSEMQRLNTQLPATAVGSQSSLGVLGGDLAGFPNGRRPGDDVTDIELRVAMGRLCHPLTLNGTETNLGLCNPEDAPVGTVPFTDGAPTTAADFDTRFPYLRAPIPGSADFPALAASGSAGD